MANRTWIGTTNGNWGTATNWVEGAVPVTGDDVFIASGAVDIDAGLAQSAVTLTSLRVGPGYTGSIGSSVGGYLEINATTFNYAGSGSAFVDGTFTTLSVTGGLGEDALRLLGSVTTARILGEAVNGLITFNPAMELTDLEVQSAFGARVDIGSAITKVGGGTFNSIVMDSGQVDCSSALVTGEVYGGALTHDTGAITTLTIEGSGTVFHKSSGTITTLTVYGGRFDGTQNANPAVTVTNASVHENGVIDVRSDIRNYTFTNGIAYHGGEVFPDLGTVITLA